MGAFGELFLYGITKKHGDPDAICYMQENLFRREGGGGQGKADLVFIDAGSGTRIGIDAKTFDCANNKRYFAVNDQHHTDIRSDCTFYYCLIAPPWGRRVFVSDLVPYKDVDRWERKELRPKAKENEKDPARVLSIDAFLSTYATSPAPNVLRDLGDWAGTMCDPAVIVSSVEAWLELSDALPALADAPLK
jgi:hypothetical protein